MLMLLALAVVWARRSSLTALLCAICLPSPWSGYAWRLPRRPCCWSCVCSGTEIRVVVVVPRECPLHLDQLHLLAVQLSHDLGLPLLREAGKLFGDVDAFHLSYAGLMARSFSAVSPSIAARSASLNPGVPRMWSTAVLVHGNG
jgi:hypothetical protein